MCHVLSKCQVVACTLLCSISYSSRPGTPTARTIGSFRLTGSRWFGAPAAVYHWALAGDPMTADPDAVTQPIAKTDAGDQARRRDDTRGSRAGDRRSCFRPRTRPARSPGPCSRRLLEGD